MSRKKKLSEACDEPIRQEELAAEEAASEGKNTEKALQVKAVEVAPAQRCNCKMRTQPSQTRIDMQHCYQCGEEDHLQTNCLKRKCTEQAPSSVNIPWKELTRFMNRLLATPTRTVVSAS